jgi:FeS assembly protein IscX
VSHEILWTDAEEIGIQLTEKFPDLDPLTVRFTDLHRYVTELEGFADDRWPGTKSGRMRRNRCYTNLLSTIE